MNLKEIAGQIVGIECNLNKINILLTNCLVTYII